VEILINKNNMFEGTYKGYYIIKDDYINTFHKWIGWKMPNTTDSNYNEVMYKFGYEMLDTKPSVVGKTLKELKNKIKS